MIPRTRLNVRPVPQLMAAVASQCWAITESGKQEIAMMALGLGMEHMPHADGSVLPEVGQSIDVYQVPHIRPSGIAILPIRGALLDRGWRCSCGCGYGFQGYDDVMKAGKEIASTPGVKGVVMPIHSPGGMCIGLLDLCDYLRSLRDQLPVLAVVDRCMCSAAAAIGAQATKTYMARDGIAGSYGTITSHYDMSKMLEDSGISVKNYTRGRYKAVGDTDTHRSAETDEELDMLTGRYFDQFASMVESGRSMSRDAFVATEARIYHGTDAITAGIADGLAAFDELIAELEREDAPHGA